MAAEHFEVKGGALAIHPGHMWAPVVGEQLLALLDRSPLDADGRTNVMSQAVAVLAQGVPPTGHGARRRTGLVVGYVQSGKTLSFTSVIALANDNRIPLVLLLTGTKRNLHAQTHKRLERDLQMSSHGTPWMLFSDPSPAPATVQEMAVVLREAMGARLGNPANPLLQAFRREHRTVVATVMKNAAQLGHLKDMLVALSEAGVNLDALPVLVIDDEADQAGLNTRAGDEEDPSSTYEGIRDLRSTLPRHTYLEYTATPQAPLLLNMLDTLAPDFIAVLNPGNGYTGGEHFFRDERHRFVCTIPQKEANEAADSEATGPPDSLEDALASYLVASLVMGTRGIKQSSMLVHPSHTKDLHDRYAQWVRSVLKQWGMVLEEGGDLRDELVEQRIRPAYENLVGGETTGVRIDDIVDALPYVTNQLQVRVVNSGTAADSDIGWDKFPFWVLVGGNKLDRGYTVEGLVTTYMPRGTGGGQADTIQQRARFFGYKAAYADLCRAWVTPATVDLYVRYVEHELALRAELAGVAERGDDLKTWRRRMLIDPALKPCRANVIGLPYTRARIKGGDWNRFERLLLEPSALEVNQYFMHRFLNERGTGRVIDPRDPRGTNQNTRFLVPLAQLLDELLGYWEHHELDGATLNAANLLLAARLDENPGLEAEVYYMRNGLVRDRGITKADPAKVVNLHEGYRPAGGEGAYPGDAAFKSDDPDTVSVQLFRVSVRDHEGHDDVPALALYVPRHLAADMILGDA